MPKIQMEIVPESEKGSLAILQKAKLLFAAKDPYAVVSGNGDADYVCGTCRVTIASRVVRGQIVNVALRCLNCGSLNMIRGT